MPDTHDSPKSRILAIARIIDAEACWASDDEDENCLLINTSATVFLLDRYADAYEDPNVGADHTRVVFPSLDTDDAR